MQFDRLKQSLIALMESVFGPRLDLCASYPCRVVQQNADNTLDVIPDSKVVPSLTQVPIYYGVPGVTAKVRKDARVVIQFANQDPMRPYATVWESGSVSELTVKADLVRLADGDRPLAREGDSVSVFLTPSMASSIVTGPKGAIPITGYILKGSPKVKGA